MFWKKYILLEENQDLDSKNRIEGTFIVFFLNIHL